MKSTYFGESLSGQAKPQCRPNVSLLSSVNALVTNSPSLNDAPGKPWTAIYNDSSVIGADWLQALSDHIADAGKL